jgi:hypothetical protein
MVLEASTHRRTGDRAARLGYVAQSDSPADVAFDQLDRKVSEALDPRRRRHIRSEPPRGTTRAVRIANDRCGIGGDQCSTIWISLAQCLVASLLAFLRQYEQIKNWPHPDDLTRPDARALYASITEVAEHWHAAMDTLSHHANHNGPTIKQGLDIRSGCYSS